MKDILKKLNNVEEETQFEGERENTRMGKYNTEGARQIEVTLKSGNK